jgi:hypothetical protein
VLITIPLFNFLYLIDTDILGKMGIDIDDLDIEELLELLQRGIDLPVCVWPYLAAASLFLLLNTLMRKRYTKSVHLVTVSYTNSSGMVCFGVVAISSLDKQPLIEREHSLSDKTDNGS